MNSEIEQNAEHQGSVGQHNVRQSKRFVPSKMMETLVPLLLLILAAALLGTILLVVLSSLKF
jgi:hypothetical protein